MKVVKVICALFICGFVSMSHAAVIFITEKDANGVVTSLIGADNVKVLDKFYNVRFLEGTCIGLFNGCDASDDFVFTTGGTARAAADALMDQVFSSTSINPLYDSQPILTRGCNLINVCWIETPFQLDPGAFNPRATTARFENRWANSKDDVFIGGLDIDTNTAHHTRLVLAVWSEAVDASAPGAAMLLLIGIAGLLVSQRRKRA